MTPPRALTLLAVMGGCASAEAQTETSEKWEREITAFVSHGHTGQNDGWNVLHLGVGFEWVHPGGLGIAAEIGPRFRGYDFSAFDDVMFSVATTYHFGFRQERRVFPFVLGGFALAFEPVPDPGPTYTFIELGGGVLLLLTDDSGLRVEARGAFSVAADEATDPGNYPSIRFGYTWVSGRSPSAAAHAR